MSKEIENPLDLGGNEEDAVASFIVLHEKKEGTYQINVAT